MEMLLASSQRFPAGIPGVKLGQPLLPVMANLSVYYGQSSFLVWKPH